VAGVDLIMNNHENELVVICENKLIIQLHRLDLAKAKLSKALVHGFTRSELVGASMDLNNIASELRAIEKDWP
jgi:hypothetical protein